MEVQQQKMRAASAGQEGFAAKGRGNGLTKGISEGGGSRSGSTYQRTFRTPGAVNLLPLGEVNSLL